MKTGAVKEGFLKEAVLIVSFEGLDSFRLDLLYGWVGLKEALEQVPGTLPGWLFPEEALSERLCVASALLSREQLVKVIGSVLSKMVK